MCSVSVCCDTKSAIHLAKNQNTFYIRSKHIYIKYNFTQDEVEHKRVCLVKDEIKENSVDKMTKFLPTNKFNLCVDLVSQAPDLM